MSQTIALLSLLAAVIGQAPSANGPALVEIPAPASLQGLELDGRHVRAIRLLGRDGDKDAPRLVIKDIAIGEELPDEQFAVPLPAGASVREVREINFLEVFTQAMQLFGAMTSEVRSEVSKLSSKF